MALVTSNVSNFLGDEIVSLNYYFIEEVDQFKYYLVTIVNQHYDITVKIKNQINMINKFHSGCNTSLNLNI